MKFFKTLFNKAYNKPIYLDFYTDNSSAFHQNPVDKFSKFIPDWYKKLPAKYEIDEETLFSKNNIRGCAGFTRLFQNGFCLPLWSDLRIKISQDGEDSYKWQFADMRSICTVHPEEQRGDYLPSTKYSHLKIDSPWLAVCSEDIEYLLIQPTWCQDTPDDAVVLPGIVNYRHQCGTNINMMLPRGTEDKLIEINSGDPLLQIVPLTEREVILRTHLITTEEYNNRKDATSPFTSFERGYYKNKKSSKGKCPFS